MRMSARATTIGQYSALEEMYSAILRPEHLCKQISDGYNTAEYLVGAYCKQNLLLIFASRSQVYKSCRISRYTARYMVHAKDSTGT